LADYPALDLRFLQVGDPGPLGELLYAALDDFQPIAIQERDDQDGWLVFFRTAPARDGAASALAPFVLDSQLTVTPVDVPDQDWARRSQANLTAVRVGRFVIAPPWDPAVSRDPQGAIRDPQGEGMPPDAELSWAPPDRGSRIVDRDQEQILIVIDPSMGFGTGHHQTTRLCLSLLGREDLRGQRMLDVGTGSGVLAIAGWRLGAASVTALDYDPDALLNARENIERNGATGAIAVVCADLGLFRGAPSSVVIANLTAAVLMQHAAALRALVSNPGLLIVSGFSPAELQDVGAALALPLADHLVEGDWVAAAFLS
jgi:ribosomal protein L11 methylase PrmA